MSSHRLDPAALRDKGNPHRDDCTGTLCPDCGCCMHCQPEDCGCPKTCGDDLCTCNTHEGHAR